MTLVTAAKSFQLYRSLMELKVFVEAGCESCSFARETAAAIRKRFPALLVTVVDIGEGDDGLPEAVFAVPTYLLDDQVVSLGNPAIEDLDNTIRSRAAAART